MPTVIAERTPNNAENAEFFSGREREKRKYFQFAPHNGDNESETPNKGENARSEAPRQPNLFDSIPFGSRSRVMR